MIWGRRGFGKRSTTLQAFKWGPVESCSTLIWLGGGRKRGQKGLRWCAGRVPYETKPRPRGTMVKKPKCKQEGKRNSGSGKNWGSSKGWTDLKTERIRRDCYGKRFLNGLHQERGTLSEERGERESKDDRAKKNEVGSLSSRKRCRRSGAGWEKGGNGRWWGGKEALLARWY